MGELFKASYALDVVHVPLRGGGPRTRSWMATWRSPRAGHPSCSASLQQPTRYTDVVISHSHLTVFGTFVIWAIAGNVYVWPRQRVRARSGASRSVTRGFWLITLGISAMGLVLTAQGLQQGVMLIALAARPRGHPPDAAGGQRQVSGGVWRRGLRALQGRVSR